MTAGFMTVFVAIGTITKVATGWFLDKSPLISLAIGVGLVVLGVAMMFGYRLPFTTPRLDVGRRDRSVVSMFVFGITAIGLYGIGMALVVTSLTVTLALANTAMLRTVRKGMSIFEDLAGVFVLLTGLYISWYWYVSITEHFNARVTTKVGDLQETFSGFVQNNQTAIVLTATAVVSLAAIGSQIHKHRRPSSP